MQCFYRKVIVPITAQIFASLQRCSHFLTDQLMLIFQTLTLPNLPCFQPKMQTMACALYYKGSEKRTPPKIKITKNNLIVQHSKKKFTFTVDKSYYSVEHKKKVNGP
ncbi:hypothetical protein GDO86_009180 [Hymenochirus boettgeri]|uniref:Uncharacterized protein n=1 Tax=Hymenochirus boettgeri TaxID=247094 RepID=A0A8T2JK04_9PIPI|nr:hypothetical protein GDO86_009180 [Hymenochirus boettgeri]